MLKKTNWESATVVTSNDEIISYIEKICKRNPRSGNVVTGGIVSCKDSKWLMSWTINRQPQFKSEDPNEISVWVYSLFTDVPGDFVKKPMKDCTGEEITQEWLYQIGVPVDRIGELAKNHVTTVPTMMPYITAFFMPRRKGDRPDVIPDGCTNLLPSLVNLQKLQEIQSLQQNILYVPLWKLHMVCFMLTVVYPKYGKRL